MSVRHFALAITGASGAVYGLRLAEELLHAGLRLSLMISAAGFTVLKEECSVDWAGTPVEIRAAMCRHFCTDATKLDYYAVDDLCAPIASGSAAPDALIIAPCSMGSLARIACGNSGNLIERCADVMLKERKPLVLVPRETPLNEIHLENMLKLSKMQVSIIPAMPGFYHQPQSIGALVDFVVGKVLDRIGVDHTLFQRWGAQERNLQ